ncbi:MAG: hypothetical protein FWG14_13845, partial [Peptococcaceae bacterium]|nr:hypothetical protein [Peptococcaceae bacterium]
SGGCEIVKEKYSKARFIKMFCGCAQLHVSMWLEKRTGTRDKIETSGGPLSLPEVFGEYKV